MKAAIDAVRKALEGLAEVEGEGIGFTSVRVDAGKLVEAASALKAAGFDHVKSVTGVDRPKQGVIEVIYHVGSTLPELGDAVVALSVSADRERPRIPSLTKVWEGCEFLEAETYDLLGVEFEGHPKLGRLLLPPDYEGLPPLRKDFKLPEPTLEVEEVERRGG